MIRSCSPTRVSAGQVTAARRPRVSCVSIDDSWARYALDVLRVRGQLGLDLGALLGPRLDELRRERPQQDLALREADAEVRHELAPQLEHAQAVRARPRVGVAQRHAAQAVGVPDRVLLGDHPAHRRAEQVEPVEVERICEPVQVVGHLRGRVRAAGDGRAADAAVVVRHDAVALRERRHLCRPALLRVGEAVHEHERLVAVTVDAVVDVEVGHADRRHGRTA